MKKNMITNKSIYLKKWNIIKMNTKTNKKNLINNNKNKKKIQIKKWQNKNITSIIITSTRM